MLTVFQKILPYFWPYRFPFLWALGQIILIAGFELLKPWPLKFVIDNILGDKPLPWQFLSQWSDQTLLLGACVAIVVFYSLVGILAVLNNYTTTSIGQNMVNDLRRVLFSHLQRLSLAFHDQQQVGDLLYRITLDTYAIQTMTMTGILPVVSALVLLGGMFLIMVQMDGLLTVLALSICPALFIAISVLNHWVTAATVRATQQESAVYSLVQRSMSDIRVIQAFTQEEEEQNRFISASSKSLAASLWVYTLQSVYTLIFSIMISTGTALVVWVGANHVLSGKLSVGELIIFTSYLLSLYTPIDKISQTWGVVEGAKVGIWRVFEILGIEQDLKDGTKDFPASGATGAVEWREVSFQYLSDQPVLDKINLQVEPGERVAIVGPTGAGKSTLLSLLPRFYDPQAGQVMIDGIDVREFQLKSLRQQVGMVLQPPFVFPLTLRDNIAYGQPEATLDEIVYAAQLARIHDFIRQLPSSYDTIIGERGVNLSEGQKQRLTIARALLRNAPILILDEPTSSVDTETEALIMQGLEELMVGRTTFIIAHRLATVRRADRIIVLRDGRIVEQGSFAELITQQGAFATLYHSQFSQEVKQSGV